VAPDPGGGCGIGGGSGLLFEMVELQPLSGRWWTKSGTVVRVSNPMRLSTRKVFICAASFKVNWSHTSQLASAGIGP
jgi:hypothetical protein